MLSKSRAKRGNPIVKIRQQFRDSRLVPDEATRTTRIFWAWVFVIDRVPSLRSGSYFMSP